MSKIFEYSQTEPSEVWFIPAPLEAVRYHISHTVTESGEIVQPLEQHILPDRRIKLNFGFDLVSGVAICEYWTSESGNSDKPDVIINNNVSCGSCGSGGLVVPEGERMVFERSTRSVSLRASEAGLVYNDGATDKVIF